MPATHGPEDMSMDRRLRVTLTVHHLQLEIYSFPVKIHTKHVRPKFESIKELTGAEASRVH